MQLGATLQKLMDAVDGLLLYGGKTTACLPWHGVPVACVCVCAGEPVCASLCMHLFLKSVSKHATVTDMPVVYAVKPNLSMCLANLQRQRS